LIKNYELKFDQQERKEGILSKRLEIQLSHCEKLEEEVSFLESLKSQTMFIFKDKFGHFTPKFSALIAELLAVHLSA